MGTTNQAKGDVLENSVKLIIEAVLASDPQFKGQKFTIASKVRDMTSGVPNEIDVLATCNADSDFETKFVFECKNWKDPVGKEVVQLLSKKVDDVGANRGFLVAKAISKHAEQQIQMERQKVRFIRCSEDFMAPFTSLQLIHTVHDVLPPEVTVTWRKQIPADQVPLDLHRMKCCLNGKPIEFARFIDARISDIAESERKSNHFRYKQEGSHWIETGREFVFSPDEFTIDGNDIEAIGIPFCAFLTCQKPKLLSKFELEGRGQCYSFEPINHEDFKKPLEFHIVTTFKKSTAS